jgi:hypothetical protein
MMYLQGGMMNLYVVLDLSIKNVTGLSERLTSN